MSAARQRIVEAAGRLGSVADDPIREAGILLAHVLGLESRTDLFSQDHEVDDAQKSAFDALVAERRRGVPVAYLLGEAEFYSHRFAVGPGVLVPRPETEHVVEVALALLPPRERVTVVDLGTGSGAIVLSILTARSAARGVATDRSAAALAFAARNARALDLSERVDFVRGDWTAPLRTRPPAWADVVVSNPPYVATRDPLPDDVRRHEPLDALIAGDDGLDDVRALVVNVPWLLRSGGRFVFEIGASQGAAVTALVNEHPEWAEPSIFRDLAGLDRVVSVLRR